MKTCEPEVEKNHEATYSRQQSILDEEEELIKKEKKLIASALNGKPDSENEKSFADRLEAIAKQKEKASEVFIEHTRKKLVLKGAKHAVVGQGAVTIDDIPAIQEAAAILDKSKEVVAMANNIERNIVTKAPTPSEDEEQLKGLKDILKKAGFKVKEEPEVEKKTEIKEELGVDKGAKKGAGAKEEFGTGEETKEELRTEKKATVKEEAEAKKETGAKGEPEAEKKTETKEELGADKGAKKGAGAKEEFGTGEETKELDAIIVKLRREVTPSVGQPEIQPPKAQPKGKYTTMAEKPPQKQQGEITR